MNELVGDIGLAEKTSAMDWASRIEIDAARLGGKPVDRATRIAVEHVVSMIADGWAERRVTADHSELTSDDVRLPALRDGHAARG